MVLYPFLLPIFTHFHVVGVEPLYSISTLKFSGYFLITQLNVIFLRKLSLITQTSSSPLLHTLYS